MKLKNLMNDPNFSFTNNKYANSNKISKYV